MYILKVKYEIAEHLEQYEGRYRWKGEFAWQGDAEHEQKWSIVHGDVILYWLHQTKYQVACDLSSAVQFLSGFRGDTKRKVWWPAVEKSF